MRFTELAIGLGLTLLGTALSIISKRKWYFIVGALGIILILDGYFADNKDENDKKPNIYTDSLSQIKTKAIPDTIQRSKSIDTSKSKIISKPQKKSIQPISNNVINAPNNQGGISINQQGGQTAGKIINQNFNVYANSVVADSDAIFQNGKSVARGINIWFNEKDTTCGFEEISVTDQFNRSLDFEYRGVIFHIQSMAGISHVEMAGIKNTSFTRVRCTYTGTINGITR
jgi:hypothetical protein